MPIKQRNDPIDIYPDEDPPFLTIIIAEKPRLRDVKIDRWLLSRAQGSLHRKNVLKSEVQTSMMDFSFQLHIDRLKRVELFLIVLGHMQKSLRR